MLRPEVAALFELASHVTRVHVIALSREYDLTRISVAEAEQLVAVPGFDRLRRKEKPANDAGPAVLAAGPARAKTKKRA